jgi:outer membrane protein assembly factor BamB
LLLCDQAKGSFLLALDKETGKQKWRTERPTATDGWGVPIIYQDQILVVGTSRVDSYHASTGESRWWIPVASYGSMGSPVVHGDMLLVAASGSDQPMFPSYASVAADVDKDKDGKLSFEESKEQKDWVEHFGWVDLNKDQSIDEKEWETARAYGVGLYGVMAIPLGGKGALSPETASWRVKRGVPYVSSPVLYGGAYYMVKDGGIVSSLDPRTGAIAKQARIEQAPGQYFASIVAADGKLFLANEQGKMPVLRAVPDWSVIAVNDIEEEIFATPAISGGRLYVRTRAKLYCFSVKE